MDSNSWGNTCAYKAGIVLNCYTVRVFGLKDGNIVGHLPKKVSIVGVSTVMYMYTSLFFVYAVAQFHVR